ncbi:MAG: hypothetical protein ACRDHY_18815 [Anaerolineales bacterium]
MPLLRWVTHALRLTRQVGAAGVDEPSRAFELATLKLESGRSGGYPLLEPYTEGARTVVTPRVQATERSMGGEPEPCDR